MEATKTVPPKVDKWRDMGYWVERVRVKEMETAKQTGNVGEFLILSTYNWRRLSAAVLNSGFLRFTDPGYYPGRSGIFFLGYRVAILSSEDDVLEVK